ncbi:unnamed protein product [Caenorhabditis angaria]|uniref:Uncharacterized protein n=1 Tax=Caenorhabditis angaria TaxID=860376 RepID=A0A9P1J1L6_9PELO|nr:unnamed protein product [Caenorhabditis angaria]
MPESNQNANGNGEERDENVPPRRSGEDGRQAENGERRRANRAPRRSRVMPDADQIQRQNQAVINGMMREAHTDVAVINGVLTKTCRKRVETESEKDFREKKRVKIMKENAQRQRVFYDRACKSGGRQYDDAKDRRTLYHCPVDAENTTKETLELVDGYGIRRKLDVKKMKEKKEAKEEFKKKQQVKQGVRTDDNPADSNGSGAENGGNIADVEGGGGGRRSESFYEDQTQRDEEEEPGNAH